MGYQTAFEEASRNAGTKTDHYQTKYELAGARVTQKQEAKKENEDKSKKATHK